jgi:hypothetical protein
MGEAPSEPGLPGRPRKSHEPMQMTCCGERNERFIDGWALGDQATPGSSGRRILQRFVCGGSRVVRAAAGKPRFGRSLSLPPVRRAVACSEQVLSDALCLGVALLNFAPVRTDNDFDRPPGPKVLWIKRQAGSLSYIAICRAMLSVPSAICL